MPSFSHTLGIGIVITSANAAVEHPSWILGSKGKNCNDICTSAGRHCIGGYWPTDTRTLLNISITAGNGVSGCVHALRSDTFNYAPTNEQGSCFYAPNPKTIACDATPPSTHQRYCPCSTSAPQIMLSGVNMSCTAFCKTRGGVCSSDPGLWPTTAAAVQAMAQPLGMSCTGGQTAVSSQPFHAPSIMGDTCYYPQAASLASCSASKKLHRRFCPCLGASLYDTPTRGSSNKPSSGHGHGCRYGGFKVGEGTGGTKRLVPGGTRANNNEDCRQRVAQYCQDANGATFNHATGDCWCEIGMQGYHTTPGNSVCWFTDGTITSGSGSLIGRFSLGRAILAGASPSTVGASLLAVAAGVSLLALGLVRWRRGGREQALDGEVLVHLEAFD